MTVQDFIPLRSREIYLKMRSGAVYRGILRRAKIGEDKILLVNIKICDRENIYNWLICPKWGDRRSFLLSKIDSILEVGEVFPSHKPWSRT